MADKIVILEDAEGNNIYPISRGLATNSVDTNAIQNGAVTSAKIDSTTYLNADSVEVTTEGFTLSTLTASLTSFAGLAILNVDVRGSTAAASSVQTHTFNIVPSSCMPNVQVGGAAIAFTSGGGTVVRYPARFVISTSGACSVTLAAGVTTNCFQLSIVYKTA